MTWIKVDTSLPDKPEVFRISELLKIDRDTVVGKLLRIWAWADTHTCGGQTNATCVSTKLLDAIAHQEGFSNAMEKAGWLICTSDGFSFPNFERHNGATAKSRALTAKRVAAHSKRTNAELTIDALAREEKIRVEEIQNSESLSVSSEVKTKPPKPKVSKPEWTMPEGVDPDHWRDWMLNRKAKRANNTPSAWAKIEREAVKAGLDIASVVQICAERSWARFESAWLENAYNAAPIGKTTGSEPKREKTIYPKPARSAP
ncbi:MAG: hypothetical protein ACK56W_24850 [Pirellula sp.]|jgi:hypothetical protein|nr:hypothetical protein [Pirellula sp.]